MGAEEAHYSIAPEVTNFLSQQNSQDTYKTVRGVPAAHSHTGGGYNQLYTKLKIANCNICHVFLVPPPPSLRYQACDCHGPLDPVSTLSCSGAAARQKTVRLEGWGRGRAHKSRHDMHGACPPDTPIPVARGN